MILINAIQGPQNTEIHNREAYAFERDVQEWICCKCSREDVACISKFHSFDCKFCYPWIMDIYQLLEAEQKHSYPHLLVA